MKRILFVIFCLLVLAGASKVGHAQSQLGPITGYPCNYNWSGTWGNVSCTCSGPCNPVYINGHAMVWGSWWENWNCNLGYVSARGSAYVLTTISFHNNGLRYEYPSGLLVRGWSTVTSFPQYGWMMVSNFEGGYGEDCEEDGAMYNGAYYYDC